MTRHAMILATMAGTALLLTPAWTRSTPRIIWNASASVPIGLYRVEPADQIALGDIAVVAPPELLANFLAERRYLPRGVPLLKRVLALEGQTVCRHDGAIYTDGTRYGTAREHDDRGRAMPIWRGCQIVQRGAAFLMNWDAPASVDSRYFGPLPLTSIIGRAIPVWTHDDEHDPASQPVTGEP